MARRRGESGRASGGVLVLVLLLGGVGCAPRGDDAAPVVPPARATAAANPLADAPNPRAAEANPRAAEAQEPGAPWQLAPLTAAEREHVRRELGGAAGVRVAAVAAGSVAARAGVRVDDLLIAIAGKPVANPDEVARALGARRGTLALTLLRAAANGEWTLVQRELALGAVPAEPATEPPTPAQPGTPTQPSVQPAVTDTPPATGSAPTAAPLDTSAAGCAGAYFAMLDFCRSQAWQREVTTPPAAVEKAAALLRQSLVGLPPATRAAVQNLPAARAELQRLWQAATEEERERQREAWRSTLLLPNPLLPQLAATRRLVCCGDSVGLDVPTRWIGAQTEDGDDHYAFFAPPGTETSWQQALHPATSPAGALFLAAAVDDELRAAPTLVAGARLIARNHVTRLAPGLREVRAFELGPGGMVLLRGPVTAGGEDHFCWVGTAPLGLGRFLAIRFLAPVARAEELLPAFSALLASLDVRKRNADAEAASLSISLYASMVGNTIVSAGWNH